jgi:hypothetical protein
VGFLSGLRQINPSGQNPTFSGLLAAVTATILSSVPSDALLPKPRDVTLPWAELVNSGVHCPVRRGVRELNRIT